MTKLTDRQIRAAKPGKMISDGRGLYLEVTATNTRRFLFRWTKAGKASKLALGIYPDISLADARDKVAELRKVVAAGGDPRNAMKPTTAPTFGEAAADYIESMSIKFRNEKHLDQWRMTLLGPGSNRPRGRSKPTPDYCKRIRSMRVDEIETEHVQAVLGPHWQRTPETASRLRGRMENVLDAATVMGHRQGDNPARWKGHLEHILPRRQKLSRGHMTALAYADMTDFMMRLREAAGTAARALEFLILTAARSGEVRLATWQEIDIDARTWTVPAGRMKAGKEHRVPLSAASMAILEVMRPDDAQPDALIFPGARRGAAMSDMTMTAVMRRMKIDATVHGFRSTFRDWAAERSGASFDVIETSLAHAVGNAVTRAYMRSDLLDARRRLMDDWANFLATTADHVLALRS
jgi:integrase